MKRKSKRKSSLINNTGFTPGYDTEKNFINYIPSEDITMRNTPYPLYGTPLDQNGNPIGGTTIMQPGQDYKFGGASYVAETRMFKEGGKQDWISNKIGQLIREGRPQKQAIAIAYSMYEQKHELGGRQLPMFQVGVGGFTDPANPDLGDNLFGPTAIGALPSSIASNSQYNINQASQNLPNGWSVKKPDFVKPAIDTGFEVPNPNDIKSNYPAESADRILERQNANDQYMVNQNMQITEDKDQDVPGSEVSKSNKKFLETYEQDKENNAREDFESGARRYQFANPYGGYGIGESLTGAGIAAGQGKTGEAALFGANALLQGSKSFLSGLGAGKRNASLTRSMYENERDYMAGRPQYAEEGGEMEYDTEMEDMDDMDDLPMKQRIAMLAQSYQMPQLDLPQYETQQQEEMRKGGYYKFGGKKYPMYQNAGMSAGDSQQAFVPQPAIYPQPEPTVNEFGFPIQKSEPQLTQTAKEQPKEVWQIWQEVTGKPWSAAKKEGFTDGSAKANMALADRLLKGEKLTPVKSSPAATKRKVSAPSEPQLNPFETPDGQYGMINKYGMLLPIQNKPGSNAPNYGGELNEVVVRAPKKKTNSGYTDPYKGFYYDKEGDLRNSKGTMVGHDGKPLNFFERNFGDVSPVPPLDENGRRMRAIPNYLNTTKETQDYMNKYRKLQQQQKNNGRSGRRFQDGGKETEMENDAAANYENRANMQLANYENDLSNSYNNMYNERENEYKNLNQYRQLSGYYQEGGMQPEMEAPQEGMPEQGGGDPMQQMMAQVVSMLQQGASPQEVLQQLVQAGIPQEQAAQIIQAAMQQAQGGQQATPQLGRGGQMIRRADGSYSKKGLWDNIRANAGSNKKPTKEMLEQEEKIRANEKEMGGYMYAEGGINNPGFRALPKNVQDKIISNMYQEGGQEGGMYAEQPQDQGNQMGQVVAQIAEALQQGANPDEILQQLIQMGVPEQEAAQMIQMVMQQMQQSQQAPPQQEQQMQQQTMKMGGKYLNMLRGKTIKSYTYNPKTDSYDIQYK
jgi:hypothetical protein